MRQPNRDGPGNARNQPDGKSENQREHDATIAYGCGNSVDREIRGKQLRSGSRSMLRLQYPLALPGAISGTQARDTILDRRSNRLPGDAGEGRGEGLDRTEDRVSHGTPGELGLTVRDLRYEESVKQVSGAAAWRVDLIPAELAASSKLLVSSNAMRTISDLRRS